MFLHLILLLKPVCVHCQCVGGFVGQVVPVEVFLKSKKWPLYCPQGSGTLRQQLLMMYGIAWYCMVLHDIAWYCMVLNGIALFCMVLHGLA